MTAGRLTDLMAAQGLPADVADTIDAVHRPLARHIAAAVAASRAIVPLVVGICGAQGSGKTTITAILAALLADQGLTVASLSIDDLYLGRAARLALAAAIHPLLRTRGVPGTHDVAAGRRLLVAAGAKAPFALPRFDKATDDPAPRASWTAVAGPVDVFLFEGWCVGAVPQPAAALERPVNPLEAIEDATGVWRRHVNDSLAGPYRSLFARLDLLLLLQAPSFDVVAGWRAEQEDKLRTALSLAGRHGGQSAAELDRFIMHFERITRHILAEMPDRADIVIGLDRHRRVDRLLLPACAGPPGAPDGRQGSQ